MDYLSAREKSRFIVGISDLDLEAPEIPTKPQLAELVTKSDSYNEDLVKNILTGTF